MALCTHRLAPSPHLLRYVQLVRFLSLFSLSAQVSLTRTLSMEVISFVIVRQCVTSQQLETNPPLQSLVLFVGVIGGAVYAAKTISNALDEAKKSCVLHPSRSFRSLTTSQT